jgi:hypothetical protein
MLLQPTDVLNSSLAMCLCIKGLCIWMAKLLLQCWHNSYDTGSSKLLWESGSHLDQALTTYTDLVIIEEEAHSTAMADCDLLETKKCFAGKVLLVPDT